MSIEDDLGTGTYKNSLQILSDVLDGERLSFLCIVPEG